MAVPPDMQLPDHAPAGWRASPGIAARKSCDDGKPTTIGELVEIPTWASRR